MLLFAMFTLGYFFGVVITLKVFGQKDKIERVQPVESADYTGTDLALTPQEIFTQLTKVNHPIDTKELSADIPLQTDLINSNKPESKQERAYATS